TRRRRRTYLFCVYGSGIRPDLHSFPTRRSSDLLPRTSSKCASMSRCSSIVLRRVLYSRTLPVTAEILSARSDTLTTLRLVCAWFPSRIAFDMVSVTTPASEPETTRESVGAASSSCGHSLLELDTGTVSSNGRRIGLMPTDES